MTPPIESIICWCSLHNIELKRDLRGVTATAFDMASQPITRITFLAAVERMPDESADVARAIGACDAIAEELCLLKPSVAHKLNLNHP